jgi:5-(carboxyamino)imidazole ribonucleotide mutase
LINLNFFAIFVKPKNHKTMEKVQPLVSIVMGSASDLEVMKQAADFLEEMHIPFEMYIISAHRTPHLIEEYASTLKKRGVKGVIAGAGGAAHLPGVIAGHTTLPVIGMSIKSSISIDGWDSILSILQMPPGVQVATVGLDAARNAAILAVQILATFDEQIADRLNHFKLNLKTKVVKAQEEIKKLHYRYLVD